MFHKIPPSEGDRGCLCKSPYETAYDYCPDTGEVTWSQLITETQRELSSLIFISLSQFHSISFSLAHTRSLSSSPPCLRAHLYENPLFDRLPGTRPPFPLLSPYRAVTAGVRVVGIPERVWNNAGAHTHTHIPLQRPLALLSTSAAMLRSQWTNTAMRSSESFQEKPLIYSVCGTVILPPLFSTTQILIR